MHAVESSTSGVSGRDVVAIPAGANYDLFGEKLGFRPLSEDRAVLVDARDLDPAEAEYLRTSAVRRCTVDNLELPDGPLIVHVDAGIIDSNEIPRLRFPVAGGPSKSAVLEAMGEVRVRSRQVVAVDVACPWEPAPELEPARAALIEELIGV